MPESKREEFIERVVEGAKNQGCPLSPRRIKEISQQVSPTTKPTRGPEVERDAKAIVAENKKLHAENKALRARVERLEAENEALKARLKKK